MRRLFTLLTGFTLGLATVMANAGMITSSLGNTASGFSDGDTPPVFLIGGAQGGQPAPFDTSYGTDGLFGGNFSATWTHSYGAIADPILSAMITIGIYDHDSAASGSQLGEFSHGGGASNLTTDLDTLFEAGGGSGDATYNEYTVTLTDFADLADGSVDFLLELMGAGLVPDLFGGGISETATNGANLIFATLTIETEDNGGPGPSPVPEPGTLLLLGGGLLAAGLRRRFRR